MFVTKTRREDETTLSLWNDGPCGFDAGDANLRRVVGNDPTNAIDPTGPGASLEPTHQLTSVHPWNQGKKESGRCRSSSHSPRQSAMEC